MKESLNVSVKKTSMQVKELFQKDAFMMMIGTSAVIDLEHEAIIRIYKDGDELNWEFETRASLKESSDEKTTITKK